MTAARESLSAIPAPRCRCIRNLIPVRPRCAPGQACDGAGRRVALGLVAQVSDPGVGQFVADGGVHRGFSSVAWLGYILRMRLRRGSADRAIALYLAGESLDSRRPGLMWLRLPSLPPPGMTYSTPASLGCASPAR